MDTLQPTERTQVRRLPDRARYERARIHAILDEGLVAHLGFVHQGVPFVIPTTYARVGERLYVHGSPASRMLRSAVKSTAVCLTVTHLDGLVLARSAFHHSMNYRSVVVVGEARVVDDLQEKQRAFQALVDHVVPGRWPEIRPPNDTEIRFTKVLALDLEEASAKLRSGPPADDEADLDWPVWAGEIPLALIPGAPLHDPTHPARVEAPEYAKGYRRPTGPR